MKTYGGVNIRIQTHIFLASALVGGKWSASRPGRFIPEMGGWVGPKPCLDDVERRKILPHWGSNSDSSAVQPIATLYTDYAIPALNCICMIINSQIYR
jgi:hypothetical protein